MPDLPSQHSRAMADQELEQILFKARNTTPLQRIQWVEEMLALLAGFESPYSKIASTAVTSSQPGPSKIPIEDL